MTKSLIAIIKASPLAPIARSIQQNCYLLRREVFGINRKILAQYMSCKGPRKLQLGCGFRILEGWLNSEYFPRSNDVIHIDATARYPVADNTFDYVFSEHMIEHVPFDNGQKMLVECFRVLKQGGKIRLSTPDLAFLIALYGEDRSDLQNQYIDWAITQFVAGAPGREPTFVINNFFRAWGHAFIYDEKVLRDCLCRAGFSHITRVAVNASEDEHLRNLENERRMPDGFLRLESLIFEATKEA